MDLSDSNIHVRRKNNLDALSKSMCSVHIAASSVCLFNQIGHHALLAKNFELSKVDARRL